LIVLDSNKLNGLIMDKDYKRCFGEGDSEIRLEADDLNVASEVKQFNESEFAAILENCICLMGVPDSDEQLSHEISNICAYLSGRKISEQHDSLNTVIVALQGFLDTSDPLSLTLAETLHFFLELVTSSEPYRDLILQSSAIIRIAALAEIPGKALTADTAALNILSNIISSESTRNIIMTIFPIPSLLSLLSNPVCDTAGDPILECLILFASYCDYPIADSDCDTFLRAFSFLLQCSAVYLAIPRIMWVFQAILFFTESCAAGITHLCNNHIFPDQIPDAIIQQMPNPDFRRTSQLIIPLFVLAAGANLLHPSQIPLSTLQSLIKGDDQSLAINSILVISNFLVNESPEAVSLLDHPGLLEICRLALIDAPWAMQSAAIAIVMVMVTDGSTELVETVAKEPLMSVICDIGGMSTGKEGLMCVGIVGKVLMRLEGEARREFKEIVERSELSEVWKGNVEINDEFHRNVVDYLYTKVVE
jgi:hypothetical protein